MLWCLTCGIPHAADATHCSNCSFPLADPLAPAWPVAPILSPQPGALPTTPHALDTDLTPVAMNGLRAPTAPLASLRTGGLIHRLRPARAMSEDEVELAAAAIVRQALTLPPEGDSTLDDLLGGLSDPDPVVRMSERDRLWLMAGLLCCLLLIVVAVAFSRFLNG